MQSNSQSEKGEGALQAAGVSGGREARAQDSGGVYEGERADRIVITNDFINKTLQIEEAFQMPERVMSILEDKELREEIFQRFMEKDSDLSYDWFTDYFQEEHGDRDKYKQDFTPECICRIIDGINGRCNNIADICSGTGGMTIKCWNQNRNAFFHCEELSRRAIPILLFNLAIRNMNAEILHTDVLNREIYKVWRLRSGECFSDIAEASIQEERKYGSVIMNPPYSLPWSGEPDERFEKYGTPPKSKADYAFVLHGMSMMSEDGRLLAVLPHGVLFRGQKEGDIRKALADDGMIDSVIGLPDNLFLNTGIPVCIMVLGKHSDGIYFIDASEECSKRGGTERNGRRACECRAYCL